MDDNDKASRHYKQAGGLLLSLALIMVGISALVAASSLEPIDKLIMMGFAAVILFGLAFAYRGMREEASTRGLG